MNVNLFRKGVFADVFMNLEMRSAWSTPVAPKSNHNCPCKRQVRRRYWCREGHMKTRQRLEWCSRSPGRTPGLLCEETRFCCFRPLSLTESREVDGMTLGSQLRGQWTGWTAREGLCVRRASKQRLREENSEMRHENDLLWGPVSSHGMFPKEIIQQ